MLETNDTKNIVQDSTFSAMDVLECAVQRREELKLLFGDVLSGLDTKKFNTDIFEGVKSVCAVLSHNSQYCSIPLEEITLAHDLRQHALVDSIVADSLNNLAACLEMTGQIAEAKPLYEESLNLRRVSDSKMFFAFAIQQLFLADCVW